MSKLILTDEHRFRLLEMTKSVMYQYDVKMTVDNFLHYTHKTEEKSGNIYWLEHVVYHLAKKILKRDDVSLMLFRASCLTHVASIDSPVHPINYLYERFRQNLKEETKQLKQLEIHG